MISYCSDTFIHFNCTHAIELIEDDGTVTSLLVIMLCAGSEVISFTANIMQFVAIYVLMEGNTVRTVLVVLSHAIC